MKSAVLNSQECHEAVQLPSPNFNRLAHLYCWAEWFTFGPLLSRCRCAFLPEMKNRHSALVIGDGDGRFTARLLLQNSHIFVEAVDASSAMLLELRRRAKLNSMRLKTHNADARELIPASSRYDLVATHFFLDCLTTVEVAGLAARLREDVTEGALWVVSEFAVPKTRYGRLIAKPLVTAFYNAFGMLTGLSIRQLPDHPAALARSGFRLIERRERLCGLLVSELWQADSR
jgi:hypothetical protein